jgi:phosphatidylinositol transfer protein SFH5
MSSESATAVEIPPALETAEAVEKPKAVEETKTVEESKAVVEPKSAPDASDATASSVPERDGKDPSAQAAGEAAPVVEAAKIPAVPSEESEPAPVVKPSATSEKNAQNTVATPLAKLFSNLPSIIEQADHNEMWGIILADESHVPTSIVLEKFLRANDKDVSKAKAQLTEALKWRKQMEPLKLLADTEYDAARFGNLGYVTTYQRADGKGKEIITWNIYGAVKDLKATFGDIKE